MIVGAFGLRKDPFRITPDPQFFFAGATMRPALEELASALLGRRGLLLVLGDSGTGKTTLLRKMETDLEAAGSIAIVVTQPRTGIDDILHRWAEKLGVEAEPGDRAALVAAIRARQRAAGRDALAAILVDEADHCSAPLLRDLIALGVPAHDGGDGLQTVLAGQKVLEARLSLELPDVHRRVAAVTHLERLSLDDVEAYVRHRLQLAGYAGPDLFPEQLIDRVAQLTDGVPRLINHLCGRALALASQAGESVVSPETLDEAARNCMLLEGETTASRPIVAEPPAAPRRAGLVEKFATQKSTAASPPAGELDIPHREVGEAPVTSRAKAKLPVASPRARLDKSAAAPSAAAHGVSAPTMEATSVDIPTPPVSKEPVKRTARIQAAERAPPETPQSEQGDESLPELPVVALVAPPAEPTDTSTGDPEEAIPADADERSIPPALGAEAETVLELPLRAMVDNGETLFTEAPASERAPAEAPVGAQAEAPAEFAVDEPSSRGSDPYVPISRAAVSKLVGRRRIRPQSETSSVASIAPPHEAPREPPSAPPGRPGVDTSLPSAAEPNPAAIFAEPGSRRRRSVIENTDDRYEPVVVRSSEWLRRAAMLGVVVVGAGAAAYVYLQPADAPEPPQTTAGATAPATLPKTPVPAVPTQDRSEAPPSSVVDDSEPKTVDGSPASRVVDEGWQDRPALPVPKVLRLPVIDPRQSSGTGATSSPKDVSPSGRSPSGSSSIDAAATATVAAIGKSQSEAVVGSGDAVVVADAAAPPISPLPTAPSETVTDDDRSSFAVAASPPATDLAPSQPVAPIVPAAPANPPKPAVSVATRIEPSSPQPQESKPASATTPQPSVPAATAAVSNAPLAAVPPPTPRNLPPATPPSVSASESAPPAGPAAHSATLTPALDPSDSRTAELAATRDTTAPTPTSFAGLSPVDLAPTAVEPLVARADNRSQSASAERPPQRAAAPGGTVPTDAAPIRTAEPTRAAAVAAPPPPPASGIRLTQGGGGVSAEQLIARGDIYLRDGDIASARLLFEAAVRLGNAAAARRIGTTYDPIEHRRLRIVGVSPNAQIALDWYRQAMDAGDADARRRHAELSAWMARGGAR